MEKHTECATIAMSISQLGILAYALIHAQDGQREWDAGQQVEIDDMAFKLMKAVTNMRAKG